MMGRLIRDVMRECPLERLRVAAYGSDSSSIESNDGWDPNWPLSRKVEPQCLVASAGELSGP